MNSAYICQGIQTILGEILWSVAWQIHLNLPCDLIPMPLLFWFRWYFFRYIFCRLESVIHEKKDTVPERSKECEEFTESWLLGLRHEDFLTYWLFHWQKKPYFIHSDQLVLVCTHVHLENDWLNIVLHPTLKFFYLYEKVTVFTVLYHATLTDLGFCSPFQRIPYM